MRYLSDEWILKADESVRSTPPLASKLVVAFKTVGGPDGERCHKIVLGPDKVRVLGGQSQSDVVFEQSWEVAVSIANGTLSAQRAFLDGAIVLSGDAAALLGHQDALAAIQDQLAELRDATAYE